MSIKSVFLCNVYFDTYYSIFLLQILLWTIYASQVLLLWMKIAQQIENVVLSVCQAVYYSSHHKIQQADNTGDNNGTVNSSNYHVRQKLHHFIFAIALSECHILTHFLAHIHSMWMEQSRSKTGIEDPIHLVDMTHFSKMCNLNDNL